MATATATATATAAVAVEEVSELDCPVCHEAFTCPKVLPCGHLLCSACLLSWGQSQPQPLCPLCQSPILGPQQVSSGSKLQDVLEALPTDLAMEALVKCQQLLKEDHPCQACVTQNATSMCLTCGDFYCSHCATLHSRMTVLKNHVVQDLSTLTPEKVATSLQSFCSVHADKRSEVHCCTHGASVCLLCATTRHRQCQEVKPLEEMVEEGRAALGKMAATLRAAETQIDEAVRQLDQHLHNTQADLQTAVAQMQTMRQRLDSALQACCQRLQSQLERECSGVTEAGNDGKACLLSRRGKLTTHKVVIQRAQGITTPDAVSGMTSSMEARLDDLDCSATLSRDAKVISKVTLVIDPEAVSRIEQQLSELGQVKVVAADVKAQPALPFRFHDKCGKYITLTEQGLTAERTAKIEYGIVLSADPMQADMLYEVRIDQTVADWGYQAVYLGAVTQAPDTVTLPAWSRSLPSAVVVHHNWIRVNGAETQSTVGTQLREVREGSTVGLALDRDRGLHLFIDGRHKALVTSHLASPCHFMVDLCYCWKKVTALPVRPVKIPV